ncbi:hypothetical protein Sfum_2256 [Syntrophobacter fumaroxidans MPOB]|uniref:Uncharacterized protein n=1 Tax=Syntrophobacter fumaroxidans (strain DSM 10017 / MPOB) TaxID=335543 RepID=A0LKI6_SYNFM|nr:hypothetical protein Sfum_2256 [Syntrophobacter fumaroxidans MPOB]
MIASFTVQNPTVRPSSRILTFPVKIVVYTEGQTYTFHKSGTIVPSEGTGPLLSPECRSDSHKDAVIRKATPSIPGPPPGRSQQTEPRRASPTQAPKLRPVAGTGLFFRHAHSVVHTRFP